MGALGIPSAHIGGIPYGGELTLVLALRYPQRCQSLVVADAVSHKDILKPVHYSKAIAQSVPNAELHILPGAGHASFWESAAEFNSILLGFLAKNST